MGHAPPRIDRTPVAMWCMCHSLWLLRGHPCDAAVMGVSALGVERETRPRLASRAPRFQAVARLSAVAGRFGVGVTGRLVGRAGVWSGYKAGGCIAVWVPVPSPLSWRLGGLAALPSPLAGASEPTLGCPAPLRAGVSSPLSR